MGKKSLNNITIIRLKINSKITISPYKTIRKFKKQIYYLWIYFNVWIYLFINNEDNLKNGNRGSKTIIETKADRHFPKFGSNA